MWRGFLSAMLVAGCVQLPPAPEDLQAKRFETVPGKSVIYLVRSNPDVTQLVTSVYLDETIRGASYPGTYFRWEVAPGQHRIAGFAGDDGNIAITTEAGKIYYVRQIVTGFKSPISVFHVTDERDGQMIALRGQLIRDR